VTRRFYAYFLLGTIAYVSLASAADLGALTQCRDVTVHRESSSNKDLNKNGDARSIEPGQALTLADLKGPGVITHFWSTVSAKDLFYPRSLVLRIYYDGADAPSVETPFGDFFGIGHGALADLTSEPVSVTSFGRSRTSYWKIPFRDSVRVTITNDSPTHRVESFYYYLDWEKHASLPDDTVYFHARYRQEHPAQPGDYLLLDTKGRGHYVGTVLSAHQMERGWFGEGDDRFYIDGEESPSLRGTGTEDYFNDAWGFRPFNTPHYGVSLFDGYFSGDRVTAYRWHLSDPVAFSTSLKVTIEHRGSIFDDALQHLGQFHERPDWVSSVAFWYQYPTAQFKTAIPPLAERLAPYRILPIEKERVRAEPEGLLNFDESGLAYMPMKPDASLEIDFDISEEGRYVLAAFMQHSLMSGVYQISLDGVPIGGPHDFCEYGMDPVYVPFDTHDLAKGTHTLTFKGQGASPKKRTLAPSFYGLQVGNLIALRLQDMKGYREKLKAIQTKAVAGK
jgi:D-arabinan exo alpha-(1,3)/(1,5)-arabinofuranosidase (non-reducing end)